MTAVEARAARRLCEQALDRTATADGRWPWYQGLSYFLDLLITAVEESE